MITENDLALHYNKITDKHYEVAMWSVQGLGYKEIATLLNIPVGTVKSRLHRASRMIDKLKGQGQGENAGQDNLPTN